MLNQWSRDSLYRLGMALVQTKPYAQVLWAEGIATIPATAPLLSVSNGPSLST